MSKAPHPLKNSTIFKEGAGFTFIELLITLSVIAIAFLPLMRMFSASLEQAYFSSDVTTARYLAQEAMERLKNLGFTEAQIEAQGDLWNPPLSQAPIELNKRKWRTLRRAIPGSDPLEVHVEAYVERSDDSREKLASFATLIEDLDWSQI